MAAGATVEDRSPLAYVLGNHPELIVVGPERKSTALEELNLGPRRSMSVYFDAELLSTSLQMSKTPRAALATLKLAAERTRWRAAGMDQERDAARMKKLAEKASAGVER
jgi:hypothetical protein